MDQAVARCVYVISDLHLGGVYGETEEGRGFRINTHVKELAEFIRELAQLAGPPARELVINGDMVDFLAEREDATPCWRPFTADAGLACTKLVAIAQRDREFFEALSDFLESGHRLTVLTGNHDTELVLPEVRCKLKAILGVKPGHDFEFIHNGEAYAVGDALIEHGNRYDAWNVVDYDALRRLSSLQSRRQEAPEKYKFKPPAGSCMVSWVINEIKEDYKFIDLLKPETDVAIPLLLALEPGYRILLATVARLGLRARQHRMEQAALPSYAGDIHAESGPEATTYISTMSTVDEDELPAADDDAAALCRVLDETLGGKSGEFLQMVDPASGSVGAVAGDISSVGQFVDRSLGMAHLLLAKDTADIGARIPAVLQALRALDKDRSFDPGVETAAEYADAANELFKSGFRYVIFGHTHLAKKVELQPGCWYLNSGTWADLMQLPELIVKADGSDARANLEPFVQALAGGNLRPWIQFNPTYVQLDLDANERVLRAEVKNYNRHVKES